jgi:hypothetical protein
MTAQQFFKNAMVTVRILWIALTVSNLLLGLITLVVPPQVSQPPDATMQLVFAGIAVALAVGSFVLPARIYAASAAQGRVEVAEPEAMRGGMRGAARFAEPLKAARRAMGLANTPYILSMAISEAVSLLGLVLHMQGAPMTVSTPFIAAGTLLAAARFPTLERLVGPFERLHGASFAASDGSSY